ncbi:MAG TPA: UDP-N-acetylglucosamine 1-carboxyvinyltransferase [Candidatus Babeliales bacterium]|nr:UDP-N-acetylglucosamine 1-carboxyvinyltransferase [Candidatus Babeliales bacterium]
MINQAKLEIKTEDLVLIERSLKLAGEVQISGAKNAVLVIMLAVLLADGKSVLSNVPDSADVNYVIKLLADLGAVVNFDRALKIVSIDTTNVNKYSVDQQIMQKMRASILVLGPLLMRQGRAEIAMPGGCVIGGRPLDYTLDNFRRIGAEINLSNQLLVAHAPQGLQAKRIVLDYPSVGATENLLMAATLISGTTEIINAALEPEVMDLVQMLAKMGAKIEICAPATIKIIGVRKLNPVEYTVMSDRLEAGCLLLAAAVTGGEIFIPNVDPNTLDIFLFKLTEMGHEIKTERGKFGIWLKATNNPKAVSIKTAPYPGFPTDLQAPMTAALSIAFGTSVIEETVYENRLIHVRELRKMGAQIQNTDTKAVITGVENLYGTEVVASDIRASFALILAGLVAHGRTVMSGVAHFRRGYDGMEYKLQSLGAKISVCSFQDLTPKNSSNLDLNI